MLIIPLLNPYLTNIHVETSDVIAVFFFFKFNDEQVTRYQSDPGQATAYMIGQLEIKKSRKYATDELDEKFSLRDFHYQVNYTRFHT